MKPGEAGHFQVTETSVLPFCPQSPLVTQLASLRVGSGPGQQVGTPSRTKVTLSNNSQ